MHGTDRDSRRVSRNTWYFFHVITLLVVEERSSIVCSCLLLAVHNIQLHYVYKAVRKLSAFLSFFFFCQVYVKLYCSHTYISFNLGEQFSVEWFVCYCFWFFSVFQLGVGQYRERKAEICINLKLAGDITEINFLL